MVKAAFSMPSDSQPTSRSTSRDRDLPPPPSLSSQSHSTTPFLSNLDEESALESNPKILPRPKIALDSDTEAEGTESDHLLSSSVSSYRNQHRGRRPKRKHTLSIDRNGFNGYGSMTHQITQTNGQWVSLNEDGAAGRPLQRQESVLKVSPHLPLLNSNVS